jgi:hypothetical protein
MAAPPRIRLSPIKLAPAPAIVPIAHPDAPAAVAPPDLTAVAVPALSVVTPLSFASPVAGAPPLPAALASDAGVPPVAATPAAASSPAPVAAPLLALAIAARPASAPAAQVDEPVSTGLMTASAAPSRIRASSVMVKWSAIAAMLLLVAFAAMKFLLPVVIEMRREKVANPVADKSAPTAVRAIQVTRQVVAKNDANVAYLGEVVSAVENKPVEVKPVPAPAPVAAPRPPPPPPPSDLSRFHAAVAQLKVDGVVSGATSRAYIDGRFVKQGEIINRALGLRFAGVDAEAHMLLFTNADNVTFRKRY